MFQHLSKYRTIVVSGPERSGTHIAARMIAQDTGFDYVDDSEFGTFNRAKFYWMCRKDRKVIHAPGMSRWLHLVPDDTLVVFMFRRLKDIHASEKRIDWNGRRYEIESYGLLKWDTAATKYHYWKNVQRPILASKGMAYDVRFDDLADHPLFKPKKERKNYRWDQTDDSGETQTKDILLTMAGPYPDPYIETEKWIDSVKGPHFFGLVEELKAVLEACPCRPRKILDIGYGWGMSCAFWLTLLDDCEVTSIDPYSPGRYAPDHVVANLTDECQERWNFMLGTAEEILPTLSPEYDLVFLDSDHGADTSPGQIRESWRLVKPGGLLAGHDYWSYPDSVGDAVDEWAVENNVPVRIARPHSREGVWWAVKDA